MRKKKKHIDQPLFFRNIYKKYRIHMFIKWNCIKSHKTKFTAKLEYYTPKLWNTYDR
jgi:hypothetical protein